MGEVCSGDISLYILTGVRTFGSSSFSVLVVMTLLLLYSYILDDQNGRYFYLI